MSRTPILSIAVVLSALAFAAPAFAIQPGDPGSDPTAAQYQSTQGIQANGGGGSGGGGGVRNGGGSQVAGTIAGGVPGSAAVGAGGANGLGHNLGVLPFTGWDGIALAGIAMAMLMAGVAIRRLVQPRR